uniref:DOCKER domain-containing protein n=1 Tax=Plectus sambesii TaxID=2011161 RepID=A0A914WPM6_9BILA
MYLRQRLESIVRPEGEQIGTELVKFMGHFLDALFDIWAANNEFDTLVFDALVVVLRLVDEPRYQNFKPVLDAYVRNEFHSAVAYEKLIPTLKDYIVRADSNHEKTLNALKALGYLMEFIVRSKENHARLPLARDGTQPNFTEMLRELLDALVQLMQSKSARMTCQNTALKHLPQTVPHLMLVFDRTELTHFLMEVIENLGPNIVARQRLSFLRDLIKTELFVDDDCRRMLLPKIIGHVVEHIEKDSSRDEALQLCADILSDILECLFGRETPIGNEDDLRLLTSLCLRPLLQTVISQVAERTYLAAYVALTVALLNEISTSNYAQYVHDRPTSLDKMDFLTEVLQVFRDLVTKPAFHSDWFHMICLQNKALLKMLRFVMSTMKDQFLGVAFDKELWGEYFHTSVAFITQRDLRFETFAERKNLNFFAHYKDLRRDCANDLRSMWFSLNMDEKVHFIPALVGPFLEVSLIEDPTLRDTTIPIFFDMMTCEFYSKTLTGDIIHNFSTFEDELIVQLDTLVDNNRGGPTYKDQFHKIMMERCNLDREMAPTGQTLIQTIDRLLTRLFEYRSVKGRSDCQENVMSRTVELLKFYKEIDQRDLYIRYVYKLYHLHKQSDNLIEAAYTLKKHADCLNWTEQPLTDWLIRNQHNRQCATHRQLKEQLFTEIATLFDDGRLWEKAIETFKELIPVYESSLFDYEKLYKLLDRLAALYRKIVNQERAESEYFLVGFYGDGHPAFLRNTEAVFRGQSYEKLNDFQQRMLSTFTGSTLMTTMDTPGEDIRSSSGRYLQIISVKPIQSKESMALFADKQKVERLIKWYYKHNEVQKFEYSRPIRRKSKFSELEENELTMMWVEKTVVVAGDKLPDILRWSKVTSRESIDVSPLEQAVITMQRSNEDLFECAEDIRTVSKKSVVVLSGKLTGVIQAFVSGGIKNYNVFFTNECKKILTDREGQQADRLKELIAFQIPILEYCLYVHASRHNEVDAKFHESLIDSFKSYRSTVEGKFGKRPSRLPQGASIQLAQPPPTARFRAMQTPTRTFSHTDDTHSLTLSPADAKRISNGHNGSFGEPPTSSASRFVAAAGLRSPLSMMSAGASAIG